MSTSANATPWPLSLYRSFVNPTLIGENFELILFGCSLIQFLNVYKLLAERNQGYSRSWWIITLLLWINIGDTVIKFVGTVQYIERIVFDGSGTLAQPLPSVYVPAPAFLGLSAGYVQCLYIYRILRLTKGMQGFDGFNGRARVLTYTVLAIAALIIVVSQGGFIYYSIILARPIMNWLPDIRLAGILCLGGAAVVDTLLCLCLVYHLRQHQNKSSHNSTNFLAGRLIRLTFETGLAPAVGQILELLFLLVTPNTGNWTAMGLLMAKVYVCSALAVYESMLAINNASSGVGQGNSHSGNNPIAGSGRPRITQANDINSMSHNDYLRSRNHHPTEVELERKINLSDAKGVELELELQRSGHPKSEKGIWVQEESRIFTS